METNNYDYEYILRKHLGLFSVNIKLPVKDNKTLGLVYTPGVAASCLEIKKDSNNAYKYTNKLNSMIVITDSSGFNDSNNFSAIPYLEAFCVYYKTIANIDSFPIVLDASLIKSSEVFQDIVNYIIPCFSAVEFFGVSSERIANFRSDSKYAFIDSSQKRKIDDLGINSNLLFAAILRSALDCQAYIDLNELVNHNMNHIIQNLENFKTKSLKNQFLDVLSKSVKYIFDNNLSKQANKEINIDKEDLSINYVMNKYRTFLLEGNDGWINTFPNNYLTKDHSNDENSLLLHLRYKGVIQTDTKLHFQNFETLNEIITWENLDNISRKIYNDPEQSNFLTCKSNLGAIITNGTAILGLGNIGALSGMPVMEGKSVLFKLFGGTDIIPLCIQETNPDKFIEIVKIISPIFSIINLEDIKAPECFKIEKELNDIIDYPVFHDDQHGTAVVVLAGLINSLKLNGKKAEDVKVIMNGAGAAGLSITQLLLRYGIRNFVICDTEGAIYEGRDKNMNDFKVIISQITNKNKETGKLSDVIKGADVFIGVSAPKAITKEMIQSMAEKPIVFALANPTPEIYPDEAYKAGAFIVATGRSDFPNQVNNSLAFPGIFRAAVDLKLKDITISMKIAASEAIAAIIDDDHLKSDYIIPGSLDPKVSIEVAKSMARVAFEEGLSRNDKINLDLLQENLTSWYLEGKLKNFRYINEKNNNYN